MNKAIIIGVGPDDGLGAQLVHRFAAAGLHVFAAGRTLERLETLTQRIASSGGEATAVLADATDEASVRALFAQAVAAPGDLELAIYNAGNNTPGRIIEMDAEYFEKSWRVCCFGGFLFGREAARTMLPQGGSLLFTGASASLRGRANFGAFNSSKGALKNLAQAMAKEYGPEGLHVGHVVIDGPIAGEKIKTGLPDYAAKLGAAGMISIQGIVDAYAYLHAQPANAWTFEVDVRTSVERW